MLTGYNVGQQFLNQGTFEHRICPIFGTHEGMKFEEAVAALVYSQ